MIIGQPAGDRASQRRILFATVSKAQRHWDHERLRMSRQCNLLASPISSQLRVYNFHPPDRRCSGDLDQIRSSRHP
jgi:hypothetical protein